MRASLTPLTKPPYKARILAHPFGSCRAPSNWGRVVARIQFLARELVALTVGAFADDGYCAAPTPLATGGFWSPRRIAGLLGFPTSD